MSTGVGLLSGGLDSILAICVLREQNIRIEAVAFITPFFGPGNAQKAVKMLNVPLQVVDITDVHLQMLKKPKHGYGSGMNPCIDCHALMFKEAGKLMQQWGADFLFSDDGVFKFEFPQKGVSRGQHPEPAVQFPGEQFIPVPAGSGPR